MSGLQDLHGPISQIYHEKQQPGSMLCAQHALNNLLQANFFTAPDLSTIARELDQLEEAYDTDSNAVNSSTNMDDTGFFSVQVLDKALEVWGLNLTPWRSETMRPFHEHPEKIPAFILNLDQHWFTLRRFGDASPRIEEDEGNGLWFNLNSSLAAPEWLSKTYLGMVISQAEAEGYSVFAVTQEDPDKPLALFRTQVDMLFSILAEPTSSSARGLENSLATLKGGSKQAVAAMGQSTYDEEDDYELQQALQASLRGSDHSDIGGFAPPAVDVSISPDPSTLTAEVDPVAASMERSRLLLQHMREQQEFAQRELWSDAELAPEEQAAVEDRRAVIRRQEEEEERELRRAIEESEALARRLTEQMSHSTGRVRPHDNEPRAVPQVNSSSHPIPRTPPIPALTDPDSDSGDDETFEGVVTHEPMQPEPTVEQIRQARLARFAQ